MRTGVLQRFALVGLGVLLAAAVPSAALAAQNSSGVRIRAITEPLGPGQSGSVTFHVGDPQFLRDIQNGDGSAELSIEGTTFSIRGLTQGANNDYTGDFTLPDSISTGTHDLTLRVQDPVDQNSEDTVAYDCGGGGNNNLPEVPLAGGLSLLAAVAVLVGVRRWRALTR